MEKYNYLECVKENVKNYIDYDINVSDFDNRESLEENLNETLFNNDSVTGNASGSYTFCRWDAEEHISHNTELIQEATENLGLGEIEYDPEKIDGDYIVDDNGKNVSYFCTKDENKRKRFFEFLKGTRNNY